MNGNLKLDSFYPFLLQLSPGWLERAGCGSGTVITVSEVATQFRESFHDIRRMPLLSTMAHFLLKAPTSHLLSVYQDEHQMKHVECNFIKEKKLRAFFEYCVSFCEISMTPLAHSPQPPVP